MIKRDKVNLDTTSADMDQLWSSIHAARDGTAYVKAHKATLTRLLMDHQKLLVAYEKN
jgi:hypothetical protein